MSASASSSFSWIARFIAAAPGSTLHVRAFAPYALPFLSLAVLSAILWRTWTLARDWRFRSRSSASLGAFDGPRYDVIDRRRPATRSAVRDADGRLIVVGKRFNAFAAEQWLAADGDDRDPAGARDPDHACDRLGCVGDLPGGPVAGARARPRGVRGGLRARRDRRQRADGARHLRGA